MLIELDAELLTGVMFWYGGNSMGGGIVNERNHTQRSSSSAMQPLITQQTVQDVMEIQNLWDLFKLLYAGITHDYLVTTETEIGTPCPTSHLG